MLYCNSVKFAYFVRLFFIFIESGREVDECNEEGERRDDSVGFLNYRSYRGGF